MKICYVCPSFYHHVFYHTRVKIRFLRRPRFELYRRLVEKGHEITVVSCRFSGEPSVEVLDGVRILRVFSFLMPRVRYPIYPFPSFVDFTRKIKSITKDDDYDVIHAYNYTHLTSLPLPLLKKILKRPLVISISFGSMKNPWSYVGGWVDKAAGVYFSIIGHVILESCNRVVVPNSAMLREALDTGIPNYKVQLIPNGVNLDVFNPEIDGKRVRKELGIKDTEKLVLFTGAIHPLKGISHLIRAARNLLKENRNLKFLIVGDGSYINEYKRMSSSMKTNLRFTGFRSDIPELLNASDIFVLPSLSEALPSSVMEASACAKPVVASRVGGIPDIVLDKKTGILIEPASENELRDALNKLLQNEGLRERMGREGRRYMETRFNWKDIVLRYERLYDEVTKQNYVRAAFH